MNDTGLDTSPPNSRPISPMFDHETENALNDLVEDVNTGTFDVESEVEFEFEENNENTIEKMFEDLEKSMPSTLRDRLMGVDPL